ncbi:metalloprotease TIKI1-like [Rhinoderma darwinii]|uniref:metalloprotease TIKI1-like n=1 Tax=Rhinoderma darwinii TaxID=43563 RepID=UPI003F67BC4C
MVESLPYCQLLRVKRTVSHERIVEKRLNTMCNKFLERGYPRSVIERATNKVKERQQSDLLVKNFNKKVIHIIWEITLEFIVKEALKSSDQFCSWNSLNQDTDTVIYNRRPAIHSRRLQATMVLGPSRCWEIYAAQGNVETSLRPPAPNCRQNSHKPEEDCNLSSSIHRGNSVSLKRQIKTMCEGGLKLVEPSLKTELSSDLCHCIQSHLNSFLWTIKRDPPSYFFGTIHVPYTRVWDFIPENSKKAFQQSNIVYFELDLTDPYTISALTSCQMLPQGENLQSVLPRDIYRRLKRHLEYVKLMMPSWMTPDQRGKGLYADYLFNAIAGNWERKRPVWVMLMVNSLTEVDIKSRGVPVLDLYLAQEAERLKKRTGAVEKVEEQCHPLNGLNFSQVIFALNQTLLQQESLRAGSLQAPYTTEDLIKHYNCGDLNAIIFNHDSSQVPNLINATLPPHELITAQEIDNYFRQELIYKRNERMGKRVKDLLEEFPEKSFFFAFGAGHFMGNNTVIDILNRYGYDVHHTPAGKSIMSGKSKKSPASKFSHSSPPCTSISKVRHKTNPRKEKIPNLLMSDNVDIMEKDDRKYKKKKSKMEKHRHFSDLWVRIQDSVTDTPPQIINGYITVEPQLRRYGNYHFIQAANSGSSVLSVFTFLLLFICHFQQLLILQ